MKTYDVLSAPKEQVKFPRRKRTFRTKPSLPLPSQSQASLTQIGWLGSSSLTYEPIDVSSDEEYHLPRPKKRRCKGKFDSKDAGQATMTQCQRGDFPSSGLQRAHDEDIKVREDGSRLHGDHASRNRFKNHSPSLERDVEGRKFAFVADEVPETSPRGIVVSPCAGSINPTMKSSALSKQYQTPHKVRFTEVPSSQTPSSAEYSVGRSARSRDIQRSPLGARSGNVVFEAQTQLDGQELSPCRRKGRGGLERLSTAMHQSPSQIERPAFVFEAATTQYDVAETAMEDPTTVGLCKRPLPRSSTIQDSQADDMFDSVTTVALESPVKSPGHVMTIQNSQKEHSGSHDSYISATPHEHAGPASQPNGVDDDEDTADDEDTSTYDAAFDPANSALDRDASRFLWTQAQQEAMSVIAEDSETDEEDLNQIRPCQEYHSVHVLSKSCDTGSATEVQDTPPNGNEYEAAKVTPRKPATSNVEFTTQYVTADHSTSRPSQLSTVVPTQSSPIRSSPGIKHEQSHGHDNNERRSWPDTLPSSPLPLPPWSSPDARQYKQDSRDRTYTTRSSISDAENVDVLTDFSLPPPPPMSSSRRGTPVSSLS